MAIGAITNIALAIKKVPDIIDKIEIIWLGGHSPICNNNKEFNFRQDIQAIKEIFASKVKLPIIPCKGIASNLKISIYELEHYLKGKNELCDYLCSRFYVAGLLIKYNYELIFLISIPFLIFQTYVGVRALKNCKNTVTTGIKDKS